MSLISLLKKKTNNTLFTTPSHGGKFIVSHKFYQWYKNDISETDTHDPQKALYEAEKYASEIYGTKYTKFLTNGSTSGIIASVLACKPKKILVWKNSHPCHKNACKLSGADYIEYELPFDEQLGLYKAICVEKAEKLIKEYSPDTLLITSPTYEGFVADVERIAQICKQNSIKLIVDEAHGALYPFSKNLPESAVKHADFTVQSLHKTAGGLNPTALLHSNDIDPTEALNMINTTSPSYPLLSSIEANIRFLASSRGKKYIENLIENIKTLGVEQLNDDITKILLRGGKETSDILYKKYKIEDEKTNDKTTMLLCGVGTDSKKFERLRKALANSLF